MSETIKFTHTDSGELFVNNGSTVFADILAIGAVHLAAKRNAETNKWEHATDLEGLEVISDKTEILGGFLNGSISSLGVLLAHVDHGEIEAEMPAIAWLIAGLSELAGMSLEIGVDINHTIKNEYKTNFNANKEGK